MKQTLLKLLEISRQRRALARLSDDALADIGLTRSQAGAEAARAPWDAPHHWQAKHDKCSHIHCQTT